MQHTDHFATETAARTLLLRESLARIAALSRAIIACERIDLAMRQWAAERLDVATRQKERANDA